jgi:hypothetical protein
MSMKTKEHMTFFPKIKRHLIPKRRYFAETEGYFASFRALWTEFLASKGEISRHAHAAHDGDTVGMADRSGDTLSTPLCARN